MNCSPEQGYIPELDTEVSSSVANVNCCLPERFSVRCIKLNRSLKAEAKTQTLCRVRLLNNRAVNQLP